MSTQRMTKIQLPSVVLNFAPLVFFRFLSFLCKNTVRDPKTQGKFEMLVEYLLLNFVPKIAQEEKVSLISAPV